MDDIDAQGWRRSAVGNPRMLYEPILPTLAN